MDKIILLSGGMDSLISFRLFYPDAVPVYVDTHSRYSLHDLDRALRLAPNLRVVSTPRLNELANGVVPHRNAFLLSYVANRYQPKEITVSAPRGELIWDQQPFFYEWMENVLRVQINNPLRKLTKTQAVRAWLDRGLPEEELLMTRSCYSTEDGQCGKCPACVKRWIALKNNGLAERYGADVRQSARKLYEGSTWRQALAYGVLPALEAWRATRDA